MEEPEDYREQIVEEVAEEVPVMIFYEESEHLKMLIRTNSGIVTRYLSKEHASTMMKWIGAKGTDTKSDVLITV